MSDQERTPTSADVNGQHEEDSLTYGHEHQSPSRRRSRSRSPGRKQRSRSRSRSSRRRYTRRSSRSHSRSRSRSRRRPRSPAAAAAASARSPGRGGDYRGRHNDSASYGHGGYGNGFGHHASFAGSHRVGYGDATSRYESSSSRRGGSGAFGAGRYGSSAVAHANHSSSHRSSARRSTGSSSRDQVNPERDNPPISRCLGIFGLSIYTQERDLKDVFGQFGSINDVQIVFDAQTGRSRGFAFVYFDTVDDAKLAKDKCNGIDMDGRKIRVDFSLTQRAHTPTPGVYMGGNPPSRSRNHQPGYSSHHSNGGGSGGGSHRADYYDSRSGYKDRSPSPHYREKRNRYSRSRSYSPRKY